jgi:hypothetical protein
MKKLFNKENAIALGIVFLGVILASVFGGAISDALKKLKAKLPGQS